MQLCVLSDLYGVGISAICLHSIESSPSSLYLFITHAINYSRPSLYCSWAGPGKRLGRIYTLVHINAETRFYAIIFSRCYSSADTQRVQGSIPCLQIIAESLFSPLSVKPWSGLFFLPESLSSLPVAYSLGLSEAFPPPYALVY